MITFYQKTFTSKKLRVLDEFKIGSWVHVEEPSQADFDKLEQELRLDRGLLTDAIDPYEVPRVQEEEGVTYIFTRVPREEGSRIVMSPILIGVADSFVFTVCAKHLSFFDAFTEGRREFFTTQKVRFMLQLLFEVDNAYARLIIRINREVRRLSAKLLESISNDDIISFVNHETILNDLLDALVPTNTALHKLLSGRFMTLRDEDKEFAEDVYLDNGQLIELSRSNLRSIMNIRNAYSTIMTNNLNFVIKLLTGLTIIFMVPNIIMSAYGMNIPLPFEKSPFAFAIVVLITATATSIAWWVLSKKKLL